MTRSDPAGWFAPALIVVGAVTALRLVLLAFNATDLFVDESQYWLWGQEPAFGYYSKPPLIGWVIGAVTWAAGSDAPFWVRAPAAVFHAATALILGRIAAAHWGRAAAIWTAATYVTLPFVAVGSLLISTDTIMAPFFAAAIWAYLALIREGRGRHAALAGAMAGLAFLAKYAAVYFLVGAALAAVFVPAARIRWGHALLMLFAFAVTILPNVLWNLGHDLVTVSHTMDNVGWVKETSPLATLSPLRMVEFVASQFAVFGPVLFAALLWQVFTATGPVSRVLVALSLPPLVVVTVQALLEKAYANWAVAAYFAATLLVVPALLVRARWALVASVTINGAIAVALPVLTLAPGLRIGDEPVLARYLGRRDLSLQILDAASAAGNVPIVADKRDVLADLFHATAGSRARVFAPRPAGAPAHYYEQLHALPSDLDGVVLLVTAAPPACAGAAVQAFDLTGGAYQGQALAGYLVDAECANARD